MFLVRPMTAVRSSNANGRAMRVVFVILSDSLHTLPGHYQATDYCGG
jgi:hypothetical protein